MNITNIEVELRKIGALVARWTEQGYVPQIEKNIALQRVQKFYELFLELDTQAQLQSSRETIITPDPRTPKPEPTIEKAVNSANDSSFGDMHDKDDDVVEYVEVERKGPEVEPTFIIFSRQITDEQKRLFTHDLFCNDPLVFHNEVQKLERLGSLDDILIYISEKYAWTQGSRSADEFVEIVMSKFQ